GKYTLYSLAFAYPVLLVSLGIIFGGLVFWGAFACSIGLMWLIIKKAGYSKNFANWGVSNKKLLGLFGAFGIGLGFFYGLIQLREWFFPFFGGVLVIALTVGLRRFSERWFPPASVEKCRARLSIASEEGIYAARSLGTQNSD